MCEKTLMTRLLSDMSSLGLPVCEVDVIFRPYSKTYYGRYYPSVNEATKAKIAIYPYEIPGEFMEYNHIVKTGVHEFTHHLQYTSGFYVRRKGIMHNQQFWELYNYYIDRAYRFGILEKR